MQKQLKEKKEQIRKNFKDFIKFSDKQVNNKTTLATSLKSDDEANNGSENTNFNNPNEIYFKQNYLNVWDL